MNKDMLFIGIGGLGAMAINNMPSHIRSRLQTIFLKKLDKTIKKVSADEIIIFKYDKYGNVHGDFFERLFEIQKSLKSKDIFIVVNWGGIISTSCAKNVIQFLTKLRKRIFLHVSMPFEFECKKSKQRALEAISFLYPLAYKISIGDNAGIFKNFDKKMKFLNFLQYRSDIIYEEIQKCLDIQIKYKTSPINIYLKNIIKFFNKLFIKNYIERIGKERT